MSPPGATNTSTADGSSQGSPLLKKLSGELRNRIYRLVLVFEDEFYVNASCYVLRRSYLQRTSLLRTCRTTQAEATSIFYGENKFILSMSPIFTSNHGFTWLGLLTLTKSVRHIRSLECKVISLSWLCPSYGKALVKILEGAVEAGLDVHCLQLYIHLRPDPKPKYVSFEEARRKLQVA